MKIRQFEDIEAWQLARELTQVIAKEEFDSTYEQARRPRAAIHGFIKYLKTYKDNLPHP